MDHEGCRQLLDSLSEFVDGELGADLCTEIDRHLQECENCRIVVDSLRKTISLYQAAAEGQTCVPEDVRQRLYHVLELDEFMDH